MIDRSTLRLAYRPIEEDVVKERLKQAKLGAAEQGEGREQQDEDAADHGALPASGTGGAESRS